MRLILPKEPCTDAFESKKNPGADSSSISRSAPVIPEGHVWGEQESSFDCSETRMRV
jgi:hypothetical protein